MSAGVVWLWLWLWFALAAVFLADYVRCEDDPFVEPEIDESYPKECIPQCKQGHWYTLGIPIECDYEASMNWLATKICREDVMLSQLMPLLPKPERCDLKGLKGWLDKHCGLPIPKATAKLPSECRPRCRAPRWYTLGIPVPDCNQMEYDIWLHDLICNPDLPVSVKDLVETARDPQKCVLNDLSHYLSVTCADVASWEPEEATSPQQNMVQALDGPPTSEADLPIFGHTSGTSYSLGMGNGKSSMPRPDPQDIYPSYEQDRSSQYYDDSQYGGSVGPAAPQSPSAGYAASGLPSLPAQCTLPHDVGQCRGSIPSFYYDATQRACKPFIYGGCGGNGNRFGSFHECQNACAPMYTQAAPFELSLQSCGFVQASSGQIQTVPVVLKITGANPNSQVAIFRAPYRREDDPMSIVAVPDNLKCAGTGLGLGGSFQPGGQQIKAWSVNTQGNGDAIFKIDDVGAVDTTVCSTYVYQAVDMSTCKLSNVLDTRNYAGG